jgi:hypothetical protein
MWPAHRAVNFSAFMCKLPRDSGSHNLLDSSKHFQACNWIAPNCRGFCVCNLREVMLAYGLILCRLLPLRVPENHKNLGKVDSMIDIRNILSEQEITSTFVVKLWINFGIKSLLSEIVRSGGWYQRQNTQTTAVMCRVTVVYCRRCQHCCQATSGYAKPADSGDNGLPSPAVPRRNDRIWRNARRDIRADWRHSSHLPSVTERVKCN